MFDEIFVKTFPGFLSIRNSQHRIVYMNENFKNWTKMFTDIDPMGKTNQEIADTCEKNVAEVFLQCHDASLSWQKNCSSNECLKKTIIFKDREGNEEHTQYFDTLKYGLVIEGEPHIFTVGYDITSMYKENQANFSASITDTLTGAYNRKYLLDNLAQYQGDYAVFIDLDNFKLVNDYEGHDIGDDILREVVTFLREKLPNNKAIVRLGGDEFLIVFSKEMEETKILEELEVFRSAFVEKFEEYRYFSFSYGLGKISGTIEDTIVDLDEKMYLYKRMHKKQGRR